MVTSASAEVSTEDSTENEKPGIWDINGVLVPLYLIINKDYSNNN